MVGFFTNKCKTPFPNKEKKNRNIFQREELLGSTFVDLTTIAPQVRGFCFCILSLQRFITNIFSHGTNLIKYCFN